MQDCMNTRNRFNPENRFIGDIEDGKRYPFGVYTKEESDEKYAIKQTESDLVALAEVVGSKADEQECVDIRARLDALEYKSIQINSFIASPSTCEMGSSQTIILTWSLNKAATQQNIDGTQVTGNSKQYTSVTTEKLYTLNVTDGKTSATKTATVKFANQIYYGSASDLSSVSELESVLSNEKRRTFTTDASLGEYIIYAIPSRLGDVTFFVGGFEGGFEDPVEQIITNASGYEETYKVYRSTNAGLGETTVEVKEG